MPPHSQQSAAAFSLPKKPFRQAEKAFETLKKFQKLVIKNERHPSWVSFVTIFLPVSQRFTTFFDRLKCRRALFRARRHFLFIYVSVRDKYWYV